MSYSTKTLRALFRLGIEPALVEARGLIEYREAAVLALAEEGANGRQHMLTPAAARAWRAMRASAEVDGVDMHIVSAFRTVDRQVELIERKLAAGQTLAQVLTMIAPPGFSEHHSACAVDIGSVDVPVLERCFEQTTAFHWLLANAADHGFALSYPEGNAAGYQYEPWHWCFHGGSD